MALVCEVKKKSETTCLVMFAMCATMRATDFFVTNKRGLLHDVTSGVQHLFDRDSEVL